VVVLLLVELRVQAHQGKVLQAGAQQALIPVSLAEAAVGQAL
jgi:hypothetical protein